MRWMASASVITAVQIFKPTTAILNDLFAELPSFGARNLTTLAAAMHF